MTHNYIVKFSVDHSREETVPNGAAPNNSGNDFLVVIPENMSSRLANNKGTDQPAHPRRLLSAFVIRFLKSTI